MKYIIAIAVLGLVGMTSLVFAENSAPTVHATAIQENLTPEEQAVLDAIRVAKENGTYIRPPEQEPASVPQYGFGDTLLKSEEKVLTLDDFEAAKQKAFKTMCEAKWFSGAFKRDQRCVELFDGTFTSNGE